MVGDGLPCGFALAKSSRTSLRAVEPDGTTPRNGVATLFDNSVLPSPFKNKKAPRLRCIVFKWWWEMDQLFTFLQPSDFSQLAIIKQLTAQNFTPQCGMIVEQNFH